MAPGGVGFIYEAKRFLKKSVKSGNYFSFGPHVTYPLCMIKS